MARKKTTLMLDEEVYDQIRLAAAQRRISMSDVVAESVKAYVAKPKAPFQLPRLGPEYKLILPPHVRLEKTSEVLNYLDEEMPLEKRR